MVTFCGRQTETVEISNFVKTPIDGKIDNRKGQRNICIQFCIAREVSPGIPKMFIHPHYQAETVQSVSH